MSFLPGITKMGVCLSIGLCWSYGKKRDEKELEAHVIEDATHKDEQKPKSKRPTNNKIGQQTLPAWKPVLTKTKASA